MAKEFQENTEKAVYDCYKQFQVKKNSLPKENQGWGIRMGNQGVNREGCLTLFWHSSLDLVYWPLLPSQTRLPDEAFDNQPPLPHSARRDLRGRLVFRRFWIAAIAGDQHRLFSQRRPTRCLFD